MSGDNAIVQGLIERLIQLVDRGTDLLHLFATCVCIPLLTAIVTADVTMRYLFNAPFDWSIEFNEILLTLILFGSLPFTTKVNGHIRMELLYRHFKGGVLRFATVLWAASGLFFSVLLAIRTANEIPFLIKINKNTEYLGIPVWTLRGFVSLCAVLMAIYFFYLLFYGVRKTGDEESWEDAMAEGED
jgi:TRAP-type C4-dicarboxylate transport system permease small subunit